MATEACARLGRRGDNPCSVNFFFVCGVLAAVAGGAREAPAQAFSEAKGARVDYTKAEIAPGKPCESLAEYQNDDIAEIHAAAVAAEGGRPAYCKVTGLLKPEIAFEVSLPEKWNGRFYMIGNGGHAGEWLEDTGRANQRYDALTAGFAFAQTNTGHDSRKEPGGTFVLSNPQKAIDYAYRAVHLTATTAKAITASYFAKPVARAYWNSCSNGGRQGLIEAQRYPEDFDGVIANAPWVSQTGFTIGAMWNQKAISSVASLTPAKLSLLAGKVMDKCDALDGVKDGLIDDPRRCEVDATNDVPACSAGQSTGYVPHGRRSRRHQQGVLGAADFRQEVKQIFPGFMPGSEAPVAGPNNAPPASAWMNFIVPLQTGGRAADFNLAENTMRYLVFTPPEAGLGLQDVRLRPRHPPARTTGRRR